MSENLRSWSHMLIAFAGLVTVATAVIASFVPAIRDVR